MEERSKTSHEDKKSMSEIAPVKKRTVFLRNLSAETEEEDLMAMFEKVVPDVKVVDVRVIRDENGVKRGIGFVDLEN